MRRVIPFVLLLVLVSGCKLRVEQTTVVHEDGSGELSVVFGFDEEAWEALEGLAGDEGAVADGLAADSPGWETRDWSEGEFRGTEAVRSFSSLDELNRLVAEEINDAESGVATENFAITRNGDSFRFDAVLSDQDLEEGLSGGAPIDTDQMDELLGTFLEIRIAVELPGEVGMHNADEVIDGKLVWIVGATDTGRALLAESALGNNFPVGMVGVGVGVIVLLIGVALLARRQRPDTIPSGSPVPSATATGDGPDPFAPALEEPPATPVTEASGTTT